MTGEERRLEILNSIKMAKSPVSGAALANKYHVSRQVIVQDIALLRAANYEISSTNRGYVIHMPHKVTRVFSVFHTDEQIEDELNTIVDMGGGFWMCSWSMGCTDICQPDCPSVPGAMSGTL